MTNPAKEAAKSNGFLFIELKEKATYFNSQTIYENLKKYFSSILVNDEFINLEREFNENINDLKNIIDSLQDIAKSIKVSQPML